VKGQGFDILPIEFAAATLSGRLGIANRDPFDRLLIAQAILGDLVLVSNEAGFDEAPVIRLW
jgi:PIN domain nuclease of toxin-antitoxin system